jgi:uncharacterized protein YgbK (DUF1537 family)
MELLPILQSKVLTKYPQNKLKNIQNRLDKAVSVDMHKIIVLDDDPTGVQTLHDISVYTDWSEDNIQHGFEEDNKIFYILTNSRSFSQIKTKAIHQEICRRIISVAKKLQRKFLIISRSDSTLRGHYPLETEVLADEIENNTTIKVDGEIFCPYLKEGGRYTIGDIHYVKYDNELIPAGQTEFAKDETFGYKSSNLCRYIEEKTQGKFKASDVVSISLEELRSGNINIIVQKLMKVNSFNKVIVNAICQDDIRTFVIAVYQALQNGKYFLFRSGAALAKEMGGIHDQPLLKSENLKSDNPTHMGGLIVAGSHTQKTTKQLQALHNIEGVQYIEFNSDLVLDDKQFVVEIGRVLQKEERLLKEGYTVVIYTKRKVLTLINDTKETALERSVKISEAVQSFVGKLTVKPAFIVAKGGITSSDIGTKALRVKQAKVMGQICPGVPVWKTGLESKFPGIPYVIFPGNVGEINTLRDALIVLKEQ